MQDVLTKLVQHDESINSQSVHAWIFTVARRAIVDRSRVSNSRPQSSDVIDSMSIELADDSSTSAELASCMEPMLDSLSDDDRALLQRVDMVGESQADVARELGLSISGLKSRMQRARQRLRGRLEDCCTIERDRVGQPTDYERRPERPCPCDRCD